MGARSFRAFAIGARQFVVQEAAEILQGRGCEDLRGVCMTLAANMVELCNGWGEEFAKTERTIKTYQRRALEKIQRFEEKTYTLMKE